MKTVIIPALLCVMSFSSVALAAETASSDTSNPVAMSSINSGDELSKAEEIIVKKNSAVTDAWQDEPNQFLH